MMKFQVWRLYEAGSTHGGMVLNEDNAFAWPIKCAGVRIKLGDSQVDVTRDEACDVAACLQLAARDG